MGFRSTFVSQDYDIDWPEWFVDKYKDTVHFTESKSGVICSKSEGKTYGVFSELEIDIQNAIDWNSHNIPFVIVWLHECGGITRVQIEQGEIKFSEPSEWAKTNGVGHNYCYGCSDVK